jgi:hypothetical protein
VTALAKKNEFSVFVHRDLVLNFFSKSRTRFSPTRTTTHRTSKIKKEKAQQQELQHNIILPPKFRKIAFLQKRQYNN